MKKIMSLTAFFISSQLWAAGTVLPSETLATTEQGLTIQLGGFGSSAVGDPKADNRFYALTDRGPNADGADKAKIFPVPDFTPRIGHFEIQQDGSIKRLNQILLKRPDSKPLSGLPNPEGYGATGEKAIDLNGKALPTDEYGLDSEGLVVAHDGSFWISDEYGPHIVHFSKEGVELERISPKGIQTQGRKLPAVFAKRRANRGMEGLALTPDGKKLVGIMQSTMNNPSKKEATNQTLTRIVTFDLTTGKTQQYLYRQNADGLSNSEIRALDNHRFLIDERDGKMPQTGKQVQKHVYLIDLSTGSEVSDAQDSENGLLVNGKTLEQNTWEELADAGIHPVNKKLVVDLRQAVNYPHEKFEGMWLMNKNKTLAVINDDDFGIAADKQNGIRAKILPLTEQLDKVTLYFVPINIK